MVDRFWYLKNTSLFGQLPPDRISTLEKRSKYRKYAAKSLVYLPADQGDSVLLLASGRVKMYHITSEGKQSILAFIDAGELFGELSLFDSGPREEFAETMEASSVILIPGSEIQLLMEEFPVVSLAITQLMGLRRRRIERRLKSLLYRSPRERIVHLLLELAEKYGRMTEQGVFIDVKLSHQEMSNVIGTTREMVTVMLGELREQRNIDITRRRIILKDMDRLAETIDEPSPVLPTTPNVDVQAAKRARTGS